MKYTLKISCHNGRVYYFSGNGNKNVCFSAYILLQQNPLPQFHRDEYIKNWKVLRYQMRIDSLKRKIFEVN